MVKTILKELIIALLLCLAIILVLGIVLYGYVPGSKTIPNQVSYSTPEQTKQEMLAAESIDEDKVIMTYEVDSTDISNYKKVNDYKPGKANPFSSYVVEQPEESETETTSGNNTSNAGSSNKTSSSSTNTNIYSNTNENTTGGKYFQDKGTK